MQLAVYNLRGHFDFEATLCIFCFGTYGMSKIRTVKIFITNMNQMTVL
jgi:hypothetical protein